MSNGHNGQPKTLQEWIRYLHMVRAIPKEHPDYPQAQEAMRFALQRIRTLNVAASSAEQGEAEKGPPISALGAVTKGLVHGASLGLGEPIAGLLKAIVPGGMGFREGAQQYREGLENIGTQHPLATVGGDVAGMAMTGAIPVGRAVQGGTATAAAIPAGRAGILSRFLTGAGQTDILPGLSLGAIQGFSAGGADPGDLGARARGAAVGGALGAGIAGAAGGLGALRVPRWLNAVKREIRKVLPKSTPPEVVDGVTEATIRQQLVKQGFDAPTQDRILATWRAGKVVVPPPTPPPTLRPGETVKPIGPQGVAIEGPAPPMSQGPFPPSLPEMQGFPTGARPIPDIGQGKTLPYYPRGGKVEQAFGAAPAGGASRPINPAELGPYIEFLRAKGSQGLPGQAQTLRELGVPIPPGADAELVRLLFP